MKLSTIDIISDIPNKAVRNRLYNLWNRDLLDIVIIDDRVWYREVYAFLPNIDLSKFVMEYLKKYMLKRYNLKYLYDLRR